MQTLREMMEFASHQVTELFRRQGVIHPMYHATLRSGDVLITAPPSSNKDESVALMKALFELKDVVSYLYIDEAWVLNAPNVDLVDLDAVRRQGLEHHPDRREVVMFMAENTKGEMLTGQRYILRPEHGKAKLSALTVTDMAGIKSEGRMVGLLKVEE